MNRLCRNGSTGKKQSGAQLTMSLAQCPILVHSTHRISKMKSQSCATSSQSSQRVQAERPNVRLRLQAVSIVRAKPPVRQRGREATSWSRSKSSEPQVTPPVRPMEAPVYVVSRNLYLFAARQARCTIDLQAIVNLSNAYIVDSRRLLPPNIRHMLYEWRSKHRHFPRLGSLILT